MKVPSARVAMLLSIGGVLVAGSAAALVNTRVLDDESGSAPASATAVTTTLVPETSTTGVPVTTQPATTVTAALSTTTTATTSATTPPSPAATTQATATTSAPAGGQATYRLGDAGSALLDTAGGQLTIVAVTPLPGWFVERADSGGSSVEIRLESESGEVRFEASLVSGVVRVSLESDDDESGGDGGGDDNSGPGGGGG